MMRTQGETHRFELQAGWAKWPTDVVPGYTHGIVVDAQDNVYVFNTSKDAVTVFDREGHFLHAWGSDFAAGAHGLFLSREQDGEYLFLTDTARRMVYKTTLSGDLLLSLGAPDLPSVYHTLEDYCPTDVAVAPNGDFYVVDGYGQSYVHQYSAAGHYIRSWGGKGAAAGQLDCPHGAWVDTRQSEPLLYVADRGNHRIQVFTLDGQHVRFISDNLDQPCCFYAFDGDLYIPDLHSRVTILDSQDRLVTHLGEDATAWHKEGWPNLSPSERVPDKFISPHAVCVDSHGDLYVAEWVSDGRVTKWARM